MTCMHGPQYDRAENVRNSVAERIDAISRGLRANGRLHETQSNDSIIPCRPAPAKMTYLVQLLSLLHGIRRSLLQFNIDGLRRLQGYGSSLARLFRLFYHIVAHSNLPTQNSPDCGIWVQ
jgi:hypothetical protein